MTHSEALQLVVRTSHRTADQLKIPAGIIGLHGDLKNAALPDGKILTGPRQHSLRWGAFLLTFASLEGFFNEFLRGSSTRPLPVNLDKIARASENEHGVRLFANDWSMRTLVPPREKDSDQFAEWRIYRGVKELRDYLDDMKSLRDRLSHGDDPFGSSNKSEALWTVTRGNSLRMLGVEGFLQATCDLVENTIQAFGGSPKDFPAWPGLPQREQISRPGK